MVKVDEWTTIRTLRAKGVSIRKIGRVCKVSRNTVRRVIREEARTVYQRKPKEEHVLKGFEKDLHEMSEKQFIGSRMLEELRKKGYSGSSVTLYRYLKRQGLKKPSNKVSMRYETAPGEQYQFDWSGYRVGIGGQERQVYCFLVVSGYSRNKAGIFAYTDTQQSVLDGLESSFSDLGGIAQQLLIDNATAMVCYHRGKDIVFNENFLEFCGTYRIEPKPCPCHWPRLKGKVENPFRYIEEHFVKGNEFESLEDLNRRFKDFLRRWCSEIHRGIQRVPGELFEEEKPLLTSLPRRPFFSSQRGFRKVSWDCLISVDGVRYSVPHLYAGKQVCIVPYLGEKLRIFNLANELIGTHVISTSKGRTVIDPGHYEGLRPTLPKSAPCIREDFLKIFEKHGKEFYLRLVKEYSHNASRWAKMVLSLRSFYRVEDIEEAMRVSLGFGSCKVSTLRHLLSHKPLLTHVFSSGPKIRSPQITRSLGYYSEMAQMGGGV
jgi:transposase